MKTQIEVNLADRSYPIVIGDGLLGELPVLMRSRGLDGRLMVVTNRVVAGLYGQRLSETLRAAGLEPELIVIPDGEGYKSLATAGKLYQSLSRRYAERGTPVLAFGGGVIGDLAGFVAATFQRGVPFVQVPTTLLAQVDSSIGGKVAVNVGNLKNMAGAFYQPGLVAADTSLLQTLPPPEIQNGLAEVIKCAVIKDPELFAYLENNMSEALAKNIGTLTHVAGRAARVKAAVVERDEHDYGERRILNFGHTLGHAIEAVSNFRVKHGAAVALGMAAAAKVANRIGLLAEPQVIRITSLIAAAGLPVTIAVKRPEALIAAMQHDKKISNGKLKFILPDGIGSVVIRDDIDPGMAVEALSA